MARSRARAGSGAMLLWYRSQSVTNRDYGANAEASIFTWTARGAFASVSIVRRKRPIASAGNYKSIYEAPIEGINLIGFRA